MTKLQQLLQDKDVKEVARLLRISVGTVERWKSGQSKPHPLGLPSVYYLLEKMML